MVKSLVVAVLVATAGLVSIGQCDLKRTVLASPAAKRYRVQPDPVPAPPAPPTTSPFGLTPSGAAIAAALGGGVGADSPLAGFVETGGMPIASAGAGGGMGGLGGMAGLGDPAEAEIQKVVSKALDDVAKTTTDELESGGSERSADRRSMSACVLAADVPRPSLHWDRPEPMSDGPSRVTILLRDWQRGDARAGADLASAVYDELRRLAASRLRMERRDHTLQATALVNEAWLKLVDQRAGWQNRSHFFALAAQAMRRILVDHARRRHTAKRGHDQPTVPVEEVLDLLPCPLPDERLLAVDEALTRLAELDPRQAQVVELRFFAGLSVEDTAQVLDVSPTTVKREWASARVWLFDAIEAPPGG